MILALIDAPGALLLIAVAIFCLGLGWVLGIATVHWDQLHRAEAESYPHRPSSSLGETVPLDRVRVIMVDGLPVEPLAELEPQDPRAT